ncbi:MAG: dihydrolipoamide acetyltransferase family protein [Candidatus Flexifilum sp.]
MAVPVVMPKQGQSVESCIIAAWKKQPGDPVSAGEVIAEVETDKAIVEVESPASGVLTQIVHNVGDDVPVMQVIAYIGEPGEPLPADAPAPETVNAAPPTPEPTASTVAPQPPVPSNGVDRGAAPAASPRARRLAAQQHVDLAALRGTGPRGRILARDVAAAAASRPKMTPVAAAMVAAGDYSAPQHGSGPQGKITKRDLEPIRREDAAPAPSAAPADASAAPTDVTVVPLKGARKVIAARMLESMQTTAQLTLNAYADARALQAYRARLKESPEDLGLRGITINDLILYAVSRALVMHPDVNAVFDGETIQQHRRVHLGFAVDTPRGLLVPVIRDAQALTLKQISARARALAAAAQDGRIAPDDLQGGTFSVTNLGSFGIDTFTPILNPPQVAILGVGGIAPRPIQAGEAIQFIPHLALSLTIDHRVIDGAPGARFLQTVGRLLAAIDLILAG